MIVAGHRGARNPVRRLTAGLAAVALVVGLALTVSGAMAPWALADDKGDGGAKPSPRAVVIIKGISVVLVSTPERLHVFVDRVEDDAPADDAEITVLPEGAAKPLTLERVAPGLFIASFARGDRQRDVFTVSGASPDGQGEETATLVYDDAGPAAATAPSLDVPAVFQGVLNLSQGVPPLRAMAAVLVAAGLGALVSMLAFRRRPERSTVVPAGIPEALSLEGPPPPPSSR